MPTALETNAEFFKRFPIVARKARQALLQKGTGSALEANAKFFSDLPLVKKKVKRIIFTAIDQSA